MDYQQGFPAPPGFGPPPMPQGYANFGQMPPPFPAQPPQQPMGPMPQMPPPMPGPDQHSPLAQMLLRSVKPSQPAPQPPVDMGRFQGALAAFGQR